MISFKTLKLERNKAIFRATNSAPPEWREEARATVELFAKRKAPFTTDEILDVLERKGTTTRENRALGGIMVKARNEGVIKAIGTRQTTRRCAHLRLKTLWIGA